MTVKFREKSEGLPLTVVIMEFNDAKLTVLRVNEIKTTLWKVRVLFPRDVYILLKSTKCIHDLDKLDSGWYFSFRNEVIFAAAARNSKVCQSGSKILILLLLLLKIESEFLMNSVAHFLISLLGGFRKIYSFKEEEKSSYQVDNWTA